jgi:hypothetical protein
MVYFPLPDTPMTITTEDCRTASPAIGTRFSDIICLLVAARREFPNQLLF